MPPRAPTTNTYEHPGHPGSLIGLGNNGAWAHNTFKDGDIHNWNEGNHSYAASFDGKKSLKEHLDDIGKKAEPSQEAKAKEEAAKYGPEPLVGKHGAKFSNYSKEQGEADKVLAGHGLTYRNVRLISEIPEVEELNIGHNLIARAALVGMDRAVREMLAAMGRSS